MAQDPLPEYQYAIVHINGRYYTRHQLGGQAPATAAELEFWWRLQAEIRQKEALIGRVEVLQLSLQAGRGGEGP